MQTGKFDEGVSAIGLKGVTKTGNKGIRDLLIYKFATQRQLFQREAPLFANDLVNPGAMPLNKWFGTHVEIRSRSCGGLPGTGRGQKQPHLTRGPFSERALVVEDCRGRCCRKRVGFAARVVGAGRGVASAWNQPRGIGGRALRH